MLTPLQISTQRFAPNGKGGYRASDVDAFMQKVYKSYTKLYNDNNVLNDRLQAVSPTIDEYNRNKAAIANALISAQSAAEAMLEQAKNEAAIVLEAANKNGEVIVSAKKEEAEKYYAERTGEADMKLRELEFAFAKLQKEADDFREAYTAKVNAQIQALIADANEKAAEIVAAAYNDAKLAKENAQETVSAAAIQLQALKEETAKVKGELSALILVADSAVKSIGDYNIDAVTVDNDVNTSADRISAEDIPAFELNVKYEPVPAETVPSITVEEVEEIVPVFEEEEIEIISEDEASSAATDEIVDLFSHSSDSGKEKNEIPDVSSYLSKIFDSVSEEDDDSFGFDNLISES